jgi:hypothetical protein
MAADYDMSLYDNEFRGQVESVREDYSRLADAYETVLGGLIHPRWLLASAGSVVIIMRWVRSKQSRPVRKQREPRNDV